MMMSSRTTTPTRTRTPVRSSLAPPARTTTTTSTTTRTTTVISSSAIRNPSPRAAIASSPMARGISPVSRNPPPPLSTVRSSGAIGASPAGRNPSPVARVASPSSRTVSPLKPSSALVAPNTPNARGASRAGIVISPRTGALRTGIRESPVRGRLGSNAGLVNSMNPTTGTPRNGSPHARETSAVQKAQLQKEQAAMNARVGQLMAMPRPSALVGASIFRVDLSRDDDLKMVHMDRIMVDPENCGSKRVAYRNSSTALVSHMGGIMSGSPATTPRSKADIGEAPIKGRIHYAAAQRSSNLVTGTTKARLDEQEASARRETESARRLRATSAAESAPWTKGPAHIPSPVRRVASVQRVRAESPISFDPHRAITPRTTRAPSACHRHHDVFTDKAGADSRSVSVATPKAARMKSADAIQREVAAQPKTELPPRKKPSIKQSPNSQATSDIFSTPYGDAKACSVRYPAGRKILETRTAGISDPNEINARSYDASPLKSRRHVSPSTVVLANKGAAGARSDDRSQSPEVTRRRANVGRNASTIGSGEEGLTSSRYTMVTSPSRRHVAAAAPSTSANAPYGTDTNEFSGVSRADGRSGTPNMTMAADATTMRGASPQRSYSSPADRARGCRSPGFFGKPSTAMKGVFNWDS